GGGHVGRGGGVVPDGGDLEPGIARGDLHGVGLHAAVVDLGLGEAARAHEVDGVDGADRAVAELVVRARVAQVVGGVDQEGLHELVGRVAPRREVGPEVLQDEGAHARGGGGGHRRAAHGGVGGVGGRRGAGHAVVAVALAAGRHDDRPDAPVVGRAPAGEVGHGVVVGVDRADGDGVLVVGRGRRGVVAAAAAPAALVAGGPE